MIQDQVRQPKRRSRDHKCTQACEDTLPLPSIRSSLPSLSPPARIHLDTLVCCAGSVLYVSAWDCQAVCCPAKALFSSIGQELQSHFR